MSQNQISLLGAIRRLRLQIGGANIAGADRALKRAYFVPQLAAGAGARCARARSTSQLAAGAGARGSSPLGLVLAPLARFHQARADFHVRSSQSPEASISTSRTMSARPGSLSSGSWAIHCSASVRAWAIRSASRSTRKSFRLDLLPD